MRVCARCVLGQPDLLRVGVLLALVPVLTRRGARPDPLPARLLPLGLARPGSRSASASQVVLELANVSSTRCGMLLVEEQVPYTLGSRPRFVLPGLEPGERRAVTYPVRSDVRGRYPLGPLSLPLTDPFGMGEHGRSFTARDQLIVIPRSSPLPPVQLPRRLERVGRQPAARRRRLRRGRRRHPRVPPRRRPAPGALALDRAPRRADGAPRGAAVAEPRRPCCSTAAEPRTAATGRASSFEWAVSAAASVGGAPGRLAATRCGMVDGTEGQESANPWAHIASRRRVHVVGRAGHAVRGRAPAAGSSSGEPCTPRPGAATGGLVVAALGEIDAEDTSLLASLHQAGTNCIALVADTTSAINDATLRAEVSARTMAQVEQLRAAGWDVVPVRSQEPLDHTWRRIGAGRTVGGARR